MVEPCEYVCTAIMILKLLFLSFFPLISSRDMAKKPGESSKRDKEDVSEGEDVSEEEDESEDEDEGDQDEGAVDTNHTAGGKRLAARVTYPVRSKKLTLVAPPTQPSTQPVGSPEVLKTEKSKTDV
jgi:hypothetical protein